MENCIFCKILKNEIPSFKIYEDEYTYAFLDISKDVIGHTLIIPKVHSDNIFSTQILHLEHIMHATKKICDHFKSLGYTGVNIINNSGKSAEQSVNHIHFHLIPRKDNDTLKIFPELKPQEIDLAEIQKIFYVKS